VTGPPERSGMTPEQRALSALRPLDGGEPVVPLRWVGSASIRLPPPPIPVGFTTFPGEIWRTPRSWVEASYPNLIYFNEVDKGGHFAAWEEPELFSSELRAAFSSLR
jgi:pimeloyl-ACP methyl ester carboxylesterase